jgi:hypothetical protein
MKGARYSFEYVMPNGHPFDPQPFRKALSVLTDCVNARRSDVETENRRREPPVVFWFMRLDGTLVGAYGVPADEGGKPMNLCSIRIPPFCDWKVVAGPGGRHKTNKEPDMGSGWLRYWVELAPEEVE